MLIAAGIAVAGVGALLTVLGQPPAAGAGAGPVLPASNHIPATTGTSQLLADAAAHYGHPTGTGPQRLTVFTPSGARSILTTPATPPFDANGALTNPGSALRQLLERGNITGSIRRKRATTIDINITPSPTHPAGCRYSLDIAIPQRMLSGAAANCGTPVQTRIHPTGGQS